VPPPRPSPHLTTPAELKELLDWDPQVSGLHAQLQSAAGQWVVVDDGLSRNGTFVNGERVLGQRRLEDGDQLEVGRTLLIFRGPEPGRPETSVRG
jgi:pSer/pThr/pTyr-binding forkhead associated (FHA) protein